MYVRTLKVPLSNILSLISIVAYVRSKVGFYFVYTTYINTTLTFMEKNQTKSFIKKTISLLIAKLVEQNCKLGDCPAIWPVHSEDQVSISEKVSVFTRKHLPLYNGHLVNIFLQEACADEKGCMRFSSKLEPCFCSWHSAPSLALSFSSLVQYMCSFPAYSSCIAIFQRFLLRCAWRETVAKWFGFCLFFLF